MPRYDEQIVLISALKNELESLLNFVQGSTPKDSRPISSYFKSMRKLIATATEYLREQRHESDRIRNP